MATSHGSGTVLARCAVPLRAAGRAALRLVLFLALLAGSGLIGAAVAATIAALGWRPPW